MIGAQPEICSRPGNMTEVELIVRVTTAHQALRAKSEGSWFRRSSGIN